MHPHMIQSSPFRKPTWRHDYVVDSLARPGGGTRFRRDEDIIIRTYRRFLVALRAAGTDAEQQALVLDGCSNLGRAYQLFWSDDQEGRRQLEAWLLTADSVEQIADRLQLDVHVIYYFALIFFDVHDRLSARDWVYLTLLKPHAMGQLATADEARWRTWRVVAYYCGAELLHDLLNAGMRSKKPSTAAELADWLDDDLQRTITHRTFESAMQLAPDDALRLFKLALTSIRTGPTSADETARQEDLNAGVEMVLKTLRRAGLGDLERQ